MREGLFEQGQQLGDYLVDDSRRDLLNKRGTAALQVKNPRLIAQHDALSVGAAAAQGNGESPVAGEIPALRDRANQRRSKPVEFSRGNDQDVARACLLPPFDRIEIDMVDVAAIHQRISRPTGSASSHAWLSSVVGADRDRGRTDQEIQPSE